jgi:hypothetical protein
LLREVIGGMWRLIGSQRIGGIPKLVFAEARNFPEIARFYHEEVILRGTALIRGVLERGIACGEFRSVDPASAILVVIAPVLMRMIWRHSIDCCAAARVSDASYFDEYFALVLRGLRRRPQRRKNHDPEFPLLLAGLAFLTGCGESARMPPPAAANAALSVSGLPQVLDWPRTLQAGGNIAAWQEAVIGAEISNIASPRYTPMSATA